MCLLTWDSPVLSSRNLKIVEELEGNGVRPLRFKTGIARKGRR